MEKPMPMELTKELWNEVKRYINTVDRAEAAETVVSVLIDHDIDADEIRQAFKSDSDIKSALAHYLRDEMLDEEEDDDDYGYEDEEEDY